METVWPGSRYYSSYYKWMYQAGEHWDTMQSDKAGSVVQWVLCKKYGLPIDELKKISSRQRKVLIIKALMLFLNMKIKLKKVGARNKRQEMRWEV